MIVLWYHDIDDDSHDSNSNNNYSDYDNHDSDVNNHDIGIKAVMEYITNDLLCYNQNNTYITSHKIVIIKKIIIS